MTKPICILQSPLFSRSGYGELSLDLAKCLLRMDRYDLKIVPTQWGACPTKFSINEMENQEEVELFNKILRTSQLPRQPELFIQVSIPNEFQAPAKYNIGITAGIETTIPRHEWIEGLNRMNVNFVTSNFTKEVFEKSIFNKQYNDGSGRVEQLKSSKPMEVLFWGANTDVFKKTSEKEKRYKIKIMMTLFSHFFS